MALNLKLNKICPPSKNFNWVFSELFQKTDSQNTYDWFNLTLVGQSNDTRHKSDNNQKYTCNKSRMSRNPCWAPAHFSHTIKDSLSFRNSFPPPHPNAHCIHNKQEEKQKKVVNIHSLLYELFSVSIWHRIVLAPFDLTFDYGWHFPVALMCKFLKLWW